MQDGWEDIKYKKRKNSNIDMELSRMYKKIKFVSGYCKRQNTTIEDVRYSEPEWGFVKKLQENIYSDFLKVGEYLKQDLCFESKKDIKKLNEMIEIYNQLKEKA